MSLVSTILTAAGYRLSGGITVSTTSDPSTATCLQWLNEIALWITGICAEQGSDLGRTIGTITTVHAAITGATKASPCVITAASHGLMTTGNAESLIHSVTGMTELNDTEYTAKFASSDTVSLYSINNSATAVSSAAYTAYSSGGYICKRKYSDLASYIYAPARYEDGSGNVYHGWIVDGHSRNPLTLRPESCLGEYDPIEYTEPAEYYIDGSNNICFPSYPDDSYVVKIPYYQIPTALSATTDTMPFLGLMDNVFIEALVIRAQNRDEYDTSFELKWQSFLLDRVKTVIAMRQGMVSRVGL